MKKDETLVKNKWIVAVSGGSDSMALLDMCFQNQIKIVVAHVNYKKRDSADRDMEGVQAYCRSRNIPCFVYVVREYDKRQNFQAQARVIRYAFFKKIMIQEAASGVLVAHHLDDVLETYYMQKMRKSIPEYYGIKEEVVIQGVLVKRVLLNETKSDLIKYCMNHKIIYYDDESNFSDAYTRNRIRHKIIDYLSLQDKQEIKQEINKKNKALALRREKINHIVSKWGKEIEQSSIQNVEEDLQEEVLRLWIIHNSSIKVVHNKNMKQLISLIYHKTGNYKHNINSTYFLICEYGKIRIESESTIAYAYQFEKVEYIKTPYFEIKKQGKVIEGVTLKKEDFPIVIRNAQKGDKIELRLGTKKVNRFFIDHKISHNERRLWPLIVNCKGNVIYVYGIGCDIKHYSNNSTMFVLK